MVVILGKICNMGSFGMKKAAKSHRTDCELAIWIIYYNGSLVLANLIKPLNKTLLRLGLLII
jgi:hypothetical protein